MLRRASAAALSAAYLAAAPLAAQNMAELQFSKPVRVSGGISASGYAVAGGGDRFAGDRLGGVVSADVPFRVADAWSVPLRAAFSNQGSRFSGPSLARFGLSPRYKWLTLHGGHRHYSLSRFITNGGTVLGGGVEVRLANFQALAFYGSLANDFGLPAEYVGLVDTPLEPYARRTAGGKVGFGGGRANVELSVLRVVDLEGSGSADSLAALGVNPGASASVALKTGFRFARVLALTLEACGNGITDNRADDAIADDEWGGLADDLDWLLPVNASSRYALAYAGELALDLPGFSLGLAYEHVDPYFNSFALGSLQNDFDNYLLRTRFSLLERRLNVSGSFGVQRNNTLPSGATTEQRLIANANLTYAPNELLSLTGGYNNFSSEPVARVVEVADSLRLTTNNQGYTVNARGRLPGGQQRHELTAMLNLQRFEVLRGERADVANATRGAHVGYHYTVRETRLRLGGALTYTGFTQPGTPEVDRYGLRLDAARRLGERVGARASWRIDQNNSDGERDGLVLGATAGLSAQFAGGVSASLSANWINRRTTRLAPFDQLRSSLQFSKSF